MAKLSCTRASRGCSLGPRWLRGANGGFVGVPGEKRSTAGLPAGGVSDRKREVDRSDAVIEVSGLRMSYDGLEAVRGIDLRVRRGEIFTFLGPNGAGKTTTVEILEGHRRRTGGEVRVLGIDPKQPTVVGAHGLAWCCRRRVSSRT